MLDKEAGIALDLGSSDGILSTDLLLKKIKSTCVDIVPSEMASTKCGEYIQHDLEQYETLNLNSRKFDYIILADIIEHLKSGSHLLKNLNKWLSPEGKIIVSVPNIAIWIYRFLFMLGKFNYTLKGTLDETHVRFYTIKTIKGLVRMSGLSIDSIKYSCIPFELVFKNRFIITILDFFYSLLVKIWPAMFAYQIIIKASQVKKPKI